MSKCLRCDFAEWISPWGPFIVVVVISKFFAKFFHCHIFQRPSSWRENLNQMQSQPFGQALNTLNSNIESVSAFAMSFADIQRKGYKFNSILDSVGELSGDKF